MLLGAVLPTEAGEKRQVKSKTPSKPAAVVTTQVASTARYTPVRQLKGELTLDQAVQLALRQNPAILNALQQIEFTRGEIIQVRALALPQITLSGSFEEQDQRLLRGGGEGGGGVESSPLSGTSLAAPTTVGSTTTVSSVASSAAGQPSIPVGTLGSGTAPSAGGGVATGTGGTTTGGAVAARSLSAPSVMRARAVTTTPSGQTVTSSNGQTVTTSDGSSQAVDINQLLQQLGNQSSNNDSVLQNKSWNITLEARQVIYAGGQIAAALKIAKFTQDSAYYQLRDTIDTIVSTVRTQFYDVLLDRALIKVQQESINLLEQQLKDQQNRFDAGTVPRFNVLQASVQLANQRPSLISALNNYAVAQVQLSKTLGLDPGPGGKPSFECVGDFGVPPQRLSLPEALDVAHARRPFLKVQRLAMLIDAENIQVEMAGYKPQINAHAGLELRNRSSSESISDTVSGWFFGVTGSWAIFDGFSTYGRVKQARSKLEQSKVTYDDSVHEVDLEVQTSFANLKEAHETISSQQETVKEADEAVRLAQERLNAGAGTQLDVLNAQVQLTSARTTEIQARANYNIALAQFQLATATDTVYAEYFKDPLYKVQKGIFARIAETGLPKLPPADEESHRDAKSH